MALGIPAGHWIVRSWKTGEAVLIGPIGAGKSTVLKTAAGLVVPTSGRVMLGSTDYGRKFSREMVRTGVTLVPQGRRLFNSLALRENSELGAFTRRDRAATQHDIERWGCYFPKVAARMGAAAASLSGGQQQLVAINRGLLSNSRILMMDEPSIGLAPIVADRVATMVQGHVVPPAPAVSVERDRGDASRSRQGAGIADAALV